MPKYRGNVGNLLQHWVLCEILEGCRNQAARLTFIDAYAMAPFATERPKVDHSAKLFDSVRDSLPGQNTPYEQSWRALSLAAPHRYGYPNSAAFLTDRWPSEYSLLLCENDLATVQELKLWSNEVRRLPKCVAIEISEGDWRARFRQGISVQGDLVLFSFDPYMINRNPVKQMDPSNIYRSDIEYIVAVANRIPQGVVVQISTYSANGDNSQKDVIAMVDTAIGSSDLEIVATVRADGQMMSLVLARAVEWSDSLRSLESRFEFWLALVRSQQSTGTAAF